MKSQRLAVFSYEQLAVATDNFKPQFSIGRGGFGNVYRGNLNGSAVAIKRLRIEGNGETGHASSQGTTEFLQEIAVCIRVRSPYLLPLFGVAIDSKQRCLIYPLMSGGNLEERLLLKLKQFPPLSCLDRIWIALNVARGLDALHSCGRVHRDIKSCNVLLDENLNPMISDMGIARALKQNETQITRHVKGTDGYLDPEYAQNGELSFATDAYSFGVILMEMLSSTSARGHLHFLHRNMGLLSEENCVKLADPLVKWRRGSVEALSSLARRCVLLAGRLRPSAKQLVRALEPWEVVARPAVEAALASPSRTGGAAWNRRGSLENPSLHRHLSTPVAMGSVWPPPPPAPATKPTPLLSSARSHGSNLRDIEALQLVDGALPLRGAASDPDLDELIRASASASASASAAGLVRPGSGGGGGREEGSADTLCIVCLANPRVSCRHLQLCTECSGGGLLLRGAAGKSNGAVAGAGPALASGGPVPPLPGGANASTPPGFCSECGAIDMDYSAKPSAGAHWDIARAKSGLFATRGAATHGETTVHGGGLDLEDDEEENETPMCASPRALADGSLHLLREGTILGREVLEKGLRSLQRLNPELVHTLGLGHPVPGGGGKLEGRGDAPAGELEAPREGEARVEEEEWGTDDDWTLQPLVELLQSKRKEGKDVAAGVIAILAQDSKKAKEALGKSAAPEALVELLKSSSTSGKEAAASALCNLASHCALNQEVLVWRARALEPLLGALVAKNTDTCKETVAKCIRNLLAGNAEIQAEASRRGFVPILVSLMRDGSQRIREYAIASLCSLASVREGQVAIAVNGAVPDLVREIRDGARRGQEAALGAVQALAWRNSENKALIVESGAIEPLLLHIRSGEMTTAALASGALCNIAAGSKPAQGSIRAAGGVGALLGLVKRAPPGDRAAVGNACAALLNLCSNSEQSQREIVALGGLPVLLSLVQTGDPGAGASAARLLAALSRHAETRRSVLRGDTIQILAERLSGGTAGGREAVAHALCVLAQEGGEVCQRAMADAGVIPSFARLLKDGSQSGRSTASQALVALASNPALRKEADRARTSPQECSVM